MSDEDFPEEPPPSSTGADPIDPASLEASRLEDELHAADDPEEADALRLQLAKHYLESLSDPVSAALHAEELLARPHPPTELLELASSLLDHESVAAPLAEHLANAYRRLGRPGSEAATLRRELGLASLPRLDAVKRRLAQLRFTDLGDLDGALELLEPMVLDAPGDDALRADYLEMVRQGDDVERAASVLTLAVDDEPDPGARSRAAFDLAELLLQQAALDAAKRALLVALTNAPDQPAALEAARRLARLESEGEEPSFSGPALALLARRETDPRARAAAAERLDETQFDVIPALEQAGEWPALAEVLDVVIELAPDDETAPLLAQVGQVRLEHLHDAEGALDALRRSLAADPRNGLGRTTLEQLMARGDHREAAAAILEPIYRGEGNDVGTLRALTTRADVAPSAARRLSLLGRAADVAMRSSVGVGPTASLFTRAVREAVNHLPDELSPWIERLRAFSERLGDRALEARVLGAALGDRPLDSTPVLELARAALEARTATGDVAEARALADRLFLAEGGSLAMLERIDALGGASDPPAERLERCERALPSVADRDARIALMHRMACIATGELGDTPGALSLWQKILDEDPRDPVAIDGMLGAYERFDDPRAVLDEVEQALELAEGPVRQRMLQRKAQALSKLGERDQALSLLNRLVDAPDVAEPSIEAIAATAHDEDDLDLYRRALERLSRSDDSDVRMSALERLGDFHYDTMGDRLAAIQSWKPAARLSRLDPSEDAHARELYERVLDASPDDPEAAEKLVEIYSRSGEWSRVPEVFSVLLRRPGGAELSVPLLLGLETEATEATAVDELVSMIEESMPLLAHDARPAAQRLMRAKARVLSSDPTRQREASETYRSLIDVFGSERDVGAFEVFIDSRGSADERGEDLRWLYEWKASHSDDPVAILLDWAATEESSGDLDVAAHALKRASGLAPEREDVLERLVRVELSGGRPEGALSSLKKLRKLAEQQPRARELDLQIAALLMNDLGRPAEAVAALGDHLARLPPGDDVLDLVRQGLQTEGGTESVADYLEKLGFESDDVALATRTLELLTRAPYRTAIAVPRRARWWSRLTSLRGRADEKLTELVQALRDVPSDLDLWSQLEVVARDVDRPAAVGDAFQGALAGGELSGDVATVVGARVIDFLDEFGSGATDIVPLLRGVLELAPDARWALDRVKLVLSSQGRWDEFFELFDETIHRAESDAAAAELLDEAALAARDLADLPERALRYLERLQPMRPDDAGVRTSLERLYERLDRKADLVKVLEPRVASLRGIARRDLQRRLATFQLDLGRSDDARATIVQVLEEGAPLGEMVDLLERLASASDVDTRAYATERLVEHFAEIRRLGDVIRVASAALTAGVDDEMQRSLVLRLTAWRLSALSGHSTPMTALVSQMRQDTGDSPALRVVAARAILEQAHEAASSAADPDALEATWWAVSELAQLLAVTGEPQRALAVLRDALSLPFPPPRARTLRRDLAVALSDAGDAEGARELLLELFAHDAGDEIAQSCRDLLVELLADRPDERAALWGSVGKRVAARDRPAARDAWERAAEAWAASGDDEARLNALTEAARLGSASARRTRVQLHREAERWPELAEALQEAFTASRGEERLEHAVTLAGVLERLGSPEQAIEPLAQIVRETPNLWSARETLARLYRATGADAALVELLQSGAQLPVPAAQRVAALLETAELLVGPLDDAPAAVRALRRAVELAPDEPKHALALSRALLKAGEHEEAVALLRRQLVAFGDRRPKRRARFHHQLATALAPSDPTGALDELRLASEIDPTDTSILYDLARYALEADDLDLAESTYRAVLLALRGVSPADDAPSRVAAYLDLSEIAARRGDDTRAGDLVESAFASAETNDDEALRLEDLLRRRGRPELLARALTHRMTSSQSLERQIEALRDLHTLFTEEAKPQESTLRLLAEESQRLSTDAERSKVTDGELWDAICSALESFVDAGAADKAHRKRADLLLEAADNADPAEAGDLRAAAARVLEALGETERARALFEELFLADPTNTVAWHAIADLHYARGSHDALFALTLEATRNDAPEERARRHLAMARLALERPAGQDVAIQCLEQALEHQADSAEAADLLIRLYEEDGRDTELLSLLESRLHRAEAEGNTEAVAMLTMRAGAVMQRVHPAAAKATYESVIDVGPREAPLLRSLVQRLDDLSSDRLADALELLVRAESSTEAVRHARRLVMLRTGASDASALERALALGFDRAPAEAFFAERLVDFYSAEKRWRDATDTAERALEERPDDPELVARLVTALTECGDAAGAKAALDRALERTPDSTDLLRARARIEVSAGRLDAARADLERAYDQDPEASEELVDVLEKLAAAEAAGRSGHALRLFDVLLQSGRGAEARSKLDTHLELWPDDPQALRRRASLAAAAGDHQAAKQTHARLAAVASTPEELTAAALGMAEACKKLGSPADAREVLERAFRSGHDPEVRSRLEVVYDEAGERANLARLLAERATEAESTTTKRDLLARAAELTVDGDPGRALEWLRQAERVDGSSFAVSRLLAKAARLLGDRETAVERLRGLLDGGTPEPPAHRALAHLDLAQIHLDADDVFEALDELQGAFRLDRRNPEAALLLGLVSIDVDDESTASRALRTVTAMGDGPSKTQKGIAYYHLARLAHLKGDARKARLMATNALTQDPDHVGARSLVDRLPSP